VLDIVITDHTGKPISDVPRDKIRILEDNVPQKILSFTPPADHVSPPDTPPVTSSADVRKLGNVPLNIIVLDELNTMFEDTAYGRYSLERYLKSQPAVLKQPTLVVSISDSNLRLLHDWTQNRDELYDMTKKHFPVYPFSMMKGGDGGTQLARCFGALLQLAQSTKGYAGRKNIVWIGKGFPSLDTDQENEAQALSDQASLKMVTAALLASRITLNIVDPTPMSSAQADLSNPELVSPDMLLNALSPNGVPLGDQQPDLSTLSFFQLAPSTGGLAFYARNDVDKQIETAINDGAQYYTLVYSPSNKTGDEALFRNITVKLDDPNLVAWTRNGYFPEHVVKPGELPPAPTVHELAFDLSSAALALIPYSGLDVSAEREKDQPLYKVTMTPIGVTFRSSKQNKIVTEFTVMTVVFGKKQKVLSHDADEIVTTVTSTDEPFSFTVPAKDFEDATRIRIVVRDAVSGHLGTVDLSPHPDEAHEAKDTTSPAALQRQQGRKHP
jgi:VWFA-related protein